MQRNIDLSNESVYKLSTMPKQGSTLSPYRISEYSKPNGVLSNQARGRNCEFSIKHSPARRERAVPEKSVANHGIHLSSLARNATNYSIFQQNDAACTRFTPPSFLLPLPPPLVPLTGGWCLSYGAYVN